jgi:serine/threonine protein kinase
MQKIKSPRKKKDLACGIDVHGSRCNVKTTSNSNFCQVRSNRCVFGKNPHTNQTYTLKAVRKALDAQSLGDQVHHQPTSKHHQPTSKHHQPTSKHRPSSPHPAVEQLVASPQSTLHDVKPAHSKPTLHETAPSKPIHPSRVRVFDIGTDLTVTKSLKKSGSYGETFTATIKTTTDVVVLKKFKDYDRKTGITDDALKEILLLQHLNAFPETKTVKCHGIAFGPNGDDLYLVLEKLEFDLYNLIQKQQLKAIRLTEPQIKTMFYKILHALNAIHGLGVIHNDIKPHNVMILKTTDGEYDIRIIDFGLSEFVGIGPTRRLSRHYRCTELFKAPDDPHTRQGYKVASTIHENYFEGNRKSFVSDVYSIAVTMVCMFAGDYPDVRRSGDELLISGRNYRDCGTLATNLSDECVGLLLEMLEPATDQRVSCSNALNHPYFAEHRGASNMDFRIGGMSPTQIDRLTSRHENYTNDQYYGRAFELSYMEDMHLNYMNDVIPCISSESNISNMRALFEWLLEKLHEKPRTTSLFHYGDYPMIHDPKKSFSTMPIFVFETLDTIINGMALAAYVLESGTFTNEKEIKLTGLVACYIYAAACEYKATSIDRLVETVPCTRAAFITSCMSVFRTCNANFQLRPIWLHLHYILLKLAHEPLSGMYARRFDRRILESLIQDSIPDVLFYYYFFRKPEEDFTIWNVVQYSMTRALSESMGVDVSMLSKNPLTKHLAMTNFDRIHRHYDAQRLDLQEL